MDNINNADLNIYPVRNKNTIDYKLKKPIHPNLPDLRRNFVLGIIAPRSSGKTTLYSNLIIRDEMFGMENLDNVYIFSPTIYQDKTAEHLREFYENSLYPQYDDSIVKDIVTYCNSFSDEDRPKTLIILDDNVGTKTKYLDFLTTRSRHSNCSLIFSCQAFKQLNKTARANLTDCILGKTYNMAQFEDIYQEVGALFGSKKYFKKLYDYATAVKYSFLYLKLDANPPRAFKNFTEEITNKFPKPKDEFTNEFEKPENEQGDEIHTDDIDSEN